jgi:hypothetical protein
LQPEPDRLGLGQRASRGVDVACFGGRGISYGGQYSFGVPGPYPITSAGFNGGFQSGGLQSFPTWGGPPQQLYFPQVSNFSVSPGYGGFPTFSWDVEFRQPQWGGGWNQPQFNGFGGFNGQGSFYYNNGGRSAFGGFGRGG